MKRCDKPSTYYSLSNGFRSCVDHAERGIWGVGTFGIGKCDQPIETREEFFARIKAGATSTSNDLESVY